MSERLSVHAKLKATKFVQNRLVSCGSGLVVAFIFDLAFPAIHAWPKEHLPAFVLHLASETPFLHFLVAEKDLDSAVANSLRWEWFSAGFLSGFCCDWIRDFLNERVFPTRDRKILISFPPLLPFDPLRGSGLSPAIDKDQNPIPWISPSHGARFKAWEKLWHFAKDKCSDGRYNAFLRPRADFLDFRWMVLAGRAGSGKTSMAVEFLQRQLSRINDLEGPARLPWGARQIILLGEWWRRIWPWATPKTGDLVNNSLGDPWDVGWVLDAGNPAYLQELLRWEPRRPTAFLVDDPSTDTVKTLVDTLSALAGTYRFAVRLLVVSQTMPKELDTEHYKTFYEDIAVLSDDAGLSNDEICNISLNFLKAKNLAEVSPKSMKAQLEALAKVSEGNPLLVEIGLHLAMQGEDLEKLKAGDLLDLRAERILKSLRLAYPSLGNRDFRRLASATLAGPGLALDGETQRTLRNHIGDDMEDLKRCFNLTRPNSAPFDGSNRGRKEELLLPSVRPAPVGDAFVQLILRTCCNHDDGNREQVAEFAWRLNPRAVTRALGRTAARNDELGRIMRQDPPIDLKVPADPVDFAFETAMAAMRAQPFIDPPDDGGREVTQLACDRIAKLVPLQAKEILQAIAPMVQEDTDTMQFRGAVPGICYLRALTRMLKEGPIPLSCEEVIKLSEKAFTSLLIVRLAQPSVGFSGAERVIEGAELLATQAGAMPPPHSDDFEHQRAALWAAVALFKAANGNFSEAEFDLGIVDAIVLDHSDQDRFAACKAYAWAGMCDAKSGMGNPTKCEELAGYVESIARPFSGGCLSPNNYAFQLNRATAWKSVCRSRVAANDLRGAEEAAHLVDQILESYDNDQAASDLRSSAWLWLALASSDKGDIDLCVLAANAVEAATKMVDCGNISHSQRKLEFFRACAWAALCGAYAFHYDDKNKSQPSADDGKQAADNQLDNVYHSLEAGRKARAISSKYSEREEFALIHAWTFRDTCLLDSNSVRRDCEHAVEGLVKLVQRWPRSEKIAENASVGYQWYAAGAGRRGSISQGDAAVWTLSELVQAFPKNRTIASCLETTTANFRLSRASARATAADVSGCVEDADFLETFARSKSNETWLRFALDARRMVAAANAKIGDVAGSIRAANCADHLVLELGHDDEAAVIQQKAWADVLAVASRTHDWDACNLSKKRLDELAHQHATEDIAADRSG